MHKTFLATATFAFVTSLVAAAQPAAAFGTCTFLDPRCPAAACIGTSWSAGDAYYACQYEVPGRLPILGAVSNCGGVSPAKNGCSGAGLLDDRWWVEIRSAGAFAGTVTAAMASATGTLTISCEIPKAQGGGQCAEALSGTIDGGQSFTLAGSAGPLPDVPAPAGQWVISVYTAP